MNIFYLSRSERWSFICLLSIILLSYTGLLALGLDENKSQKASNDIPINYELKIKINASTITEWDQLKGVGLVLGERIIKYRNLLGGYHSVEQLKEVYGLEAEIIKAFEHQIEIDSTWHQYDLNLVKFKVLLAHPYFDYPVVKSIFNYKSQHGAFESLEELRNLDLVDEKLYPKIVPYLRITNDSR